MSRPSAPHFREEDFRPREIRYIRREAARIDEFAVFEAAIRSNENVLYRIVLSSQSSRVSIKRLTAGQAVKYFAEYRRVGMEF